MSSELVTMGSEFVRLYSSEAFNEVYHNALGRARRQIYFVAGAITTRAPEPIAFRNDLHAALDRGVRLALLVDAESTEAHHRQQFLTDLRKRGAEVRVQRTATSGMLIVDKAVALVCDNSGGKRRCCASIESSALVHSLQCLVENTGERSWNLEFVLEWRCSALSLEVLELLSAGCKDETGASRLGVSVRTYRRHVAEWIQALQAKSRFEAGVRAAKLGLPS